MFFRHNVHTKIVLINQGTEIIANIVFVDTVLLVKYLLRVGDNYLRSLKCLNTTCKADNGKEVLTINFIALASYVRDINTVLATINLARDSF